MLAPIVLMMAGGGFLLYLLSGGEKWKTKQAQAGERYYLRARISPPFGTATQWRNLLSNDQHYRLLMLDYRDGILQTVVQYLVPTPIHRVIKMPVGPTGGTTITIVDLKRLPNDSREYPDMPVALLPGAEHYVPPVMAPNNLRNMMANALYSQNPAVIQQTANNLEALGWPELAEPLRQSARQLTA